MYMTLENEQRELDDFQKEIYEKYFKQDDIKEMKNLIRKYEDISIAEKVYAGKQPIGFCTDKQAYIDKQEGIEARKRYFRRLVLEEELDKLIS